MGGVRADLNGGVLPYGTDRNATARGAPPTGNVANGPGGLFGLRAPAADPQWVLDLKAAVSCYDPVGQAHFVAAAIFLLNKKVEAKTGSKADEGSPAGKFAMFKERAARMLGGAHKNGVPYDQIYGCKKRGLKSARVEMLKEMKKEGITADEVDALLRKLDDMWPDIKNKEGITADKVNALARQLDDMQPLLNGIKNKKRITADEKDVLLKLDGMLRQLDRMQLDLDDIQNREGIDSTEKEVEALLKSNEIRLLLTEIKLLLTGIKAKKGIDPSADEVDARLKLNGMWQLLNAMRTGKDIDSFRPQLAGKRKAVDALLKDPDKRREVIIEAACQQLELLVATGNGEIFRAGARAAMKQGLEIAFPQLTAAEVNAKVAKVTEGDDVANLIPSELAVAFHKMLERDTILEDVVRQFPERLFDPLSVEPFILERVFKEFSARTETEWQPKDAGELSRDDLPALREVIEDIGDLLRREISDQFSDWVEKKGPTTLKGLTALADKFPEDKLLKELPPMTEMLDSVLLTALRGLILLDAKGSDLEAKESYLEAKESDLSRRVEVIKLNAFPPDGKAREDLTVGDLHEVVKAFITKYPQQDTPALHPPGL